MTLSFDIFLFDLIAEIRHPKPYDDFVAYHKETMAMTVRFLREKTSMTYPEIFELFGVSGNFSRYDRVVNKINEITYKEFKLKLCIDLD